MSVIRRYARGATGVGLRWGRVGPGDRDKASHGAGRVGDLCAHLTGAQECGCLGAGIVGELGRLLEVAVGLG